MGSQTSETPQAILAGQAAPLHTLGQGSPEGGGEGTGAAGWERTLSPAPASDLPPLMWAPALVSPRSSQHQGHRHEITGPAGDGALELRDCLTTALRGAGNGCQPAPPSRTASQGLGDRASVPDLASAECLEPAPPGPHHSGGLGWGCAVTAAAGPGPQLLVTPSQHPSSLGLGLPGAGGDGKGRAGMRLGEPLTCCGRQQGKVTSPHT